MECGGSVCVVGVYQNNFNVYVNAVISLVKLLR